MRSTWNIDGGGKNAFHAHGLELAEYKPSRWTCQPVAIQSAWLNDDGISRDGAQRANQVPEKQAAKIRGHSEAQQQLYRGRDALRNQKRIENPHQDYEQNAEYTSHDLFNDTAGIELVR